MPKLKFVPKDRSQTYSKERDSKLLLSHGYELGKEIGSGASSKVKLARWADGRQTKDMAVKIIDLRHADDDFKKKFLPRELNIWTQLNHENIIKIFTQITCGPRIYVFMELAENGDVLTYLQQHGEAPEPLAKEWIFQLVLALKYCHSDGIAHRDIKCENLLIDEKMRLKLADSGYSRFCLDKTHLRRLLSTTFCGSEAYAAPEVLQGQPYNPFRSDVWSVGVCLFVMLNNSMPFDDSHPAKLRKQQLSKELKFRPGIQISKQAEQFIRRALEPDPKKRSTIYALHDDPWLKAGRKLSHL